MREQLVLPEENRRERALKDRQEQFAALLGVSPEQLRHLQFCDDCGGDDYQWTDWCTSELQDTLDFINTPEDALKYRAYLADIACKSCDATGFKDGSFQLEVEQWLMPLGAQPAE